MSRQSALLWTGLAGFLFVLTGIGLNYVSNQSAQAHLKLGTWENQIRRSGQEDLSFSLRLDSLSVLPVEPLYELQVRQSASEFNQQLHPGVIRPSTLVEAFSLEPMQIRKIGDTPYRFRLKAFYPDFTFQYAYPQQQDTIPPKAPGITLALTTPMGEEVVTLRSDQPKLSKLDDVVNLGCTLQFSWYPPQDSLSLSYPDTVNAANAILFTGEDKQIHFRFNGIASSVPMALNRFYPIPGNDSIGFTVLQCFPDIALLTAHPGSKSKMLNNPVAGVEVWKLEGLSQEVFLYPTSSGKSGGQWDVPGSDLLVGLAISHKEIATHCQCYISIADSSRQFNKQVIVSGQHPIAYAGHKMRVIECDPNGFWVTLSVRRAIGQWFILVGAFIILVAMIVYWVMRNRNKNQLPNSIQFHDQDQLVN